LCPACWSLPKREAVRGDLTESGEAGGRALREVLGLVVRRQAAAWKDWRPWVALVGLVVPLGMLLGLNSVWIGRSYDLYLWIIRNYAVIDPAILRNTGLEVGRGVFFLVCHSLLLGCWAWSAGFVLGAMSRRAIRLNGAVFCLLLLLGECWAAPRYRYYVVGAVFSKSIYSVMVPIVLLAVLVLLPAVWGMYQACRRPAIGLLHAIFFAVAVGGLSVLAPRSALWWCNWPVVYVFLTAGWRHWHGERASA
jgi:hypothetical protein